MEVGLISENECGVVGAPAADALGACTGVQEHVVHGRVGLLLSGAGPLAVSGHTRLCPAPAQGVQLRL